MSSESQPRPWVLKLLVGMIVFLGIGAVGGGMALLAEPSGDVMQMSVDLLDGSPFNDFLIPGLFLFFVLGLFSFFVAYALWTQPVWHLFDRLQAVDHEHWAWNAAVLLGMTLVLWIIIEFAIIGFAWLQVVYGLLGVVILALALMPATRAYFAA